MAKKLVMVVKYGYIYVDADTIGQTLMRRRC